METLEKFVTVGEASRILVKSADTVRRYEREGKLVAIRVGTGIRLFREQDVQQLAKKQRI